MSNKRIGGSFSSLFDDNNMEETESLNPPATALQVLKLTLGEQQ